MHDQKVLILGVTGMLGHVLFTEFQKNTNIISYGTARTLNGVEKFFAAEQLKNIRLGVDAENFDAINRAMASIQPDVVINCIGLVKQLPKANDPLAAITVNAQLPHRISLICRNAKARMIHISTDCVFSGSKGSYSENDVSDATDLYGRTKFLGEVDYPHCVTLRTSIIGHELKTKLGLLEWLLSQTKDVKGFTNAIYSGFPTVELARIISEKVIPDRDLKGLYHVSAEPISKYELIKLIATVYGKKITIEPFDDFYCDRSLASHRFQQKSGYCPPSWPSLIDIMHKHYVSSNIY